MGYADNRVNIIEKIQNESLNPYNSCFYILYFCIDILKRLCICNKLTYRSLSTTAWRFGGKIISSIGWSMFGGCWAGEAPGRSPPAPPAPTRCSTVTDVTLFYLWSFMISLWSINIQVLQRTCDSTIRK